MGFIGSVERAADCAVVVAESAVIERISLPLLGGGFNEVSLLTRARQGMVIVVPNGDDGIPPDETRKPEWYDAIYDYLKGVGIPELGAAAP